MILYFKRTIATHGADAEEAIVYAVRVNSTTKGTDPVRAFGAFPPGWRPTDFPGQVLRDPASSDRFWFCAIPRAQFRHYRQLARAEAEALHPGIAAFAGETAPPNRASSRIQA